MTVSLFKITPTPPTSIELRPGEEGKLSFTIESLAAPGRVHEIMLQALRVGADGKGTEVDWLIAGPRRTLLMSGGKTETVTITARPTPASPRGEHRVKLVIADRDRPNDVYADSPSVVCEVRAPIEVKEAPRRRSWWWIPVVAGALLLVGGGILIIAKLAGGEPGPAALGEACGGEPARACDEGLLCVGGTCLLAGGATCEPARADLCASRECVAARRICAIPLGGACDPEDKALVPAVPCVGNSTCHPIRKRCELRRFPIPIPERTVPDRIKLPGVN